MCATSWQLSRMKQLIETDGTERVRGDQCQFGATASRGPKQGSPTMTPTGFLSNHPMVLRALSRICTGKHGVRSRADGGKHVTVEGSLAKDSAVYQRGLCRAMLRGAADQLNEDSLVKTGCFGMRVPDDDAAVEREIRGPAQGFSGRFRADLTGQVLHDATVIKARAVELTFFHSKGVWTKKPERQARAKTGRPQLSVRWVDVNNGADLNQNYRSRLVARELEALDKSGASYFVPAPPLEALRPVLGLATSKISMHQPDWDPLSPTRQQVSFVDVKRAYFNAKLDPFSKPVFVDLPPEDPDSKAMCAQLLRHMYGTRGAADGWQEGYSTAFVGLGFRQGESCPNGFWHADKDVCCPVHGDDFTSTGSRVALDCFEAEVAKHYEITICPRIGPAPSDAKEGRSLNRIIRWCDHGVEYEADPRQAEKLIAECGLDGSKGVATPGVKPTFHELEADVELRQGLDTAFRGSAARGNYLAADRVDAQFACKEVCRWMSRPTGYSWQALKRVCRFPRSAPRVV